MTADKWQFAQQVHFLGRRSSEFQPVASSWRLRRAHRHYQRHVRASPRLMVLLGQRRARQPVVCAAFVKIIITDDDDSDIGGDINFARKSIGAAESGNSAERNQCCRLFYDLAICYCCCCS